MDMYQQASRLKLRFETSRGQLSVEDLWELPLTSAVGKVNLDDIARALHRDVRNSIESVTFVDAPVTQPNVELQLRFDIIKDIIAVRVAERNAAATAEKRKEEKQKLLALIARKSDAELEGKTIEELTAMVNAL